MLLERGEITDVKIIEIKGATHRVECGENNVTVGNSTHSKCGLHYKVKSEKIMGAQHQVERGVINMGHSTQ